MRSATLALGLIIALGWLPLDTTAATVAETHVQRIARGAARLTTFSNGTGTLYLNLKGLRPGRWSGQLQRGTCDVPGARVAVLATIVVPSNGSVARTVRLTTSQASGRVLRLTQGSTGLCVTFGATGRTGVLIADAFDRKTAAGWDVAAAGGAYEPRAPGLRVDGNAGVLELMQPGANLLAVLPATSARDVSIRFSVATDRPVAGDRQYVYGEARRNGEADAYRLGVRLGSDGRIAVQAGRVAQGVEVPLGHEVQIAGVTHRAGVPINMRGEVAGTYPTRLRIRVWPDGRPEPTSWAYVATDSAPSLQRAGAVGLRGYLPRAAQNAPVRVRFDNLDVATIVPPPAQPQPDSAVLIGAGDIAVCRNEDDSATASLIRTTPGTVFTAGDNVYPNGTLAEFRTCYEEAWGSFKDRTRPVPGNHDYNTKGAAGYYAYFGAAAGDPSEGWYAYDLGAWRIYALNSNCGIVRCDAGSPQERWLRADLAANPRTCVAAIWHYPRFSSRGGHDNVAALWQALADANADLILSGHDHDYERFAPLDPTGAVDRIRGIRQIIVGTGGVGLTSFGAIHPGSEVRNNSTHGVLKLLLHPWGYTWEFVPVAGRTFRDAGETLCH